MNKHNLGKLSVFVCAVAACSSNRAGAMDIIKDGKPAAVIVVAESAAGPAEATAKRKAARRQNLTGDAHATQVLNDWIKKISDVELPVAATANENQPAIYVGHAAIKAGLKLGDIESPTSEGLRIRVKGHRALIAGQSDEATLRAVCRFLEKLGCRYFMDHPLGEVFPRTKNLSIADTELTEKPAFLMRKIWGSNWSGGSLWKIWNGAGGLDLATGHSWAKYVPARKYFGDHPEFFSLRNGERREGEWLCTTNPDLRKTFTQAVVDAVRGGDRHPSISPPDGRGYCDCPVCKAQDDPNYREPTSGSPVMSDRYVDFVDAVAKEAARVSPASILNFYAYADYTQPPIHHAPVSKNLCVWLAPIRYCRFHGIRSECAYRQELDRVITDWAKVVSKPGYREYNYNLAEALTPIPKLSVWKRDVPYLKERGFIGVNFECIASWCIYGPHMYQSIRLAYDPTMDADALMDDYYRMFFGPKAGPPMKQYWETLDGAVANMPHHTGSFFALQHVFTPTVLKRCRGLLNEAARAAADDPNDSARVTMCDMGFVNAEKYMALLQAVNSGDWAGAQKTYDELVANCDALIEKEYANPYTKNYLERFVGAIVKAGAQIAAPPNKIALQLPDAWRFCYDEKDDGASHGYARAELDDASWKTVKTYSTTLAQQGISEQQTIMWYRTPFDLAKKSERLVLWFAEIDGDATVYLNGVEAGKSEKRRKPFAVDVTDAVRAGRNVVAVRVDHRQPTELYLGGIIRPVLLIETK